MDSCFKKAAQLSACVPTQRVSSTSSLFSSTISTQDRGLVRAQSTGFKEKSFSYQFQCKINLLHSFALSSLLPLRPPYSSVSGLRNSQTACAPNQCVSSLLFSSLSSSHMSHMQCGRSPCSSRRGRATAVAFLLPSLLLLLPLLLVCCYQLAHNVAPTPALTARGRASSFTSENLQLEQITASFFASQPFFLMNYSVFSYASSSTLYPCE